MEQYSHRFNYSWYSLCEEGHNINLRSVMQRIQEFGLTIRVEKCNFWNIWDICVIDTKYGRTGDPEAIYAEGRQRLSVIARFSEGGSTRGTSAYEDGDRPLPTGSRRISSCVRCDEILQDEFRQEVLFPDQPHTSGSDFWITEGYIRRTVCSAGC